MSCPRTSTLVTFLSAASFLLSLFRSYRAIWETSGTSQDTQSLQNQSPHWCLEVLTLWPADERTEGRKPKGCGQLSSCTRPPPPPAFCLLDQPRESGIWHWEARDCFRSQQTPSQYDYDFNLPNSWRKLIRSKRSNLEVVYQHSSSSQHLDGSEVS